MDVLCIRESWARFCEGGGAGALPLCILVPPHHTPCTERWEEVSMSVFVCLPVCLRASSQFGHQDTDVLVQDTLNRQSRCSTQLSESCALDTPRVFHSAKLMPGC